MTSYKSHGFCKAITSFLALVSLGGCQSELPLPFRTDDTPTHHIIGDIRFTIPKNYIDSLTTGGGFFIAAWPTMEGRTKDNFEEFTKRNLGILVSRGNQNSLKIIYRLDMLDEHSECDGDPSDLVWANIEAKREGREPPDFNCRTVQQPAVPQGSQFGFEHSLVKLDERGAGMGNFTHQDIYVRRKENGEFEALMKCQAEPAPPKRDPQCSLWVIYPQLPGLLFEISFSRRDALDDVNRIEQAVRDKFLDFHKAGDRDYATDEDARETFQEVERIIDQGHTKDRNSSPN